MSAPALALAFFDQAREIYGTARSGTTIIFEGRHPVPHPEGPALEPIGDGWRAELAGVLVIFGGAFLITPGFLTDIVGVILLIPPTRALVRRMLVRRLGRRVEVRTRQRGDVEGTATEYDVPPGRLER